MVCPCKRKLIARFSSFDLYRDLGISAGRRTKRHLLFEKLFDQEEFRSDWSRRHSRDLSKTAVPYDELDNESCPKGFEAGNRDSRVT